MVEKILRQTPSGQCYRKTAMPTYVLMTKLSTRTTAEEGSRRARGKDWKEKVERLCPGLKWTAHYALLGTYDFMDIYEAPDDETAFKVSMLSRAEGASSAESWPAIGYGQFLELHDAVEAEHAGKRVTRGSGKSR